MNGYPIAPLLGLIAGFVAALTVNNAVVFLLARRRIREQLREPEWESPAHATGIISACFT